MNISYYRTNTGTREIEQYLTITCSENRVNTTLKKGRKEEYVKYKKLTKQKNITWNKVPDTKWREKGEKQELNSILYIARKQSI